MNNLYQINKSILLFVVLQITSEPSRSKNKFYYLWNKYY